MEAIDPSEALNLCVEYVDRNVREGRGDHLAIVYGDERYTYRQVLDNVCKAANLLEELGLRPEQRVLLALSDHPEFVWFWFATVRLGGVVSAVNPEIPAAEMAYYLDYTRSTILVAEEALLGTTVFPEESPWLSGVVACRGGAGGLPAEGATGTASVLAGSGPNAGPAFSPIEPPHAAAKIHPGKTVRWEDERHRLSADHTPASTVGDDVGVMLYTSGSTGFPKAAVHRHVDFVFNTEAYALPILELTEGDVTVSVSKLFFGYGLGGNLLFPFRVGATVVLFPERTTAEKILEEVSRHGATVLIGVPTLLNSMVHLELEGRGWDWSSLRVTTSAGEALPAELCRRYTSRFGHEILDGIGSAELFHVYISNRKGEVVPGSLGTVIEGYEAKICDDLGHEVPDGELGSLWIKGESVALGYFRRTEETRKHFFGPWYVSSDKFRRDPEGRFWYGGRSDDLLKIGGRYLAPIEVENTLLGHPDVKEAAVVGYVDGAGLIKPRAVVVPREGCHPTEELAGSIRDFVRERLEPWKAPRQVVFRESLPRNDRGKVLKRQLKDP